MSMADRDGFIWYDGKLVPWREATTHVLTHTLHYGLGVFEGVRCYQTAAGPAINTKHVKTQVLVENGGTIVIGGIFTLNEREDVTKVPFLGDVPVLGNLFKTRSKSNSKTELLVFITPKVVSDRTALR